MRPFHLLQITDCHLGSRANEALLGLNTDESLCDVLQLAQQQERPDLILATGDISNDGGGESYNRFIAFVRRYFPSTPLAWLPGNHDEPREMANSRERPIEGEHTQGGWHLIFLDSKIPQEEGGELAQAELRRLEASLQAEPQLPTLVFLHHQAVPVGSAWVDQYVVKNSEQFFAIIDRFSNVKALSWGHVHQEFNGSHKQVALHATPSTCVQFVPCHDEFQVDSQMPGYRRYLLYPDGRFSTEVVRVANKSYGLDFAATGY